MGYGQIIVNTIKIYYLDILFITISTRRLMLMFVNSNLSHSHHVVDAGKLNCSVVESFGLKSRTEIRNVLLTVTTS